MKLLVTTTVDENYLPYKDLFEWCVKRAYPEYDVFVHQMEISKTNLAAAWRFIIDVDLKGEYDYIYITDSDILILPEIVPLHTFHIREMEASGLPYSNVISWLNQQGTPPKPEYSNARMMGTHFANREYFKKTHNLSEHFKHKIHDDCYDGLKPQSDEEILFKIIHLAELGLPKVPYSFNNRLHGIHLGNFRKNKPWIWDATMTIERAAQYRDLCDNEEFKSLKKDACAKSPMIKEEFSRLDGAIRTRYA
jgi:hypothetical protein